MDISTTEFFAADAERIRSHVSDLEAYPAWLGLVRSAQPLPPDREGAAWSVVLQGQVGPLRRSKRLRMVRTAEGSDHARFERRERDGRDHSEWILSSHWQPVAGGTRLTMGLHYGGSLFGALLERVLVGEIERGRRRLEGLVAGPQG